MEVWLCSPNKSQRDGPGKSSFSREHIDRDQNETYREEHQKNEKGALEGATCDWNGDRIKLEGTWSSGKY